MYEKKIQTIEESANWISYNLKRIADQLEQMNGHEGRRGPSRGSSSQNQQNREYVGSPRDQEIPF